MDENNKDKEVLKNSDSFSNKFPAGLRVLVVDDDIIGLGVLEKMLLACRYKVTKCSCAQDAVFMLREDKSRFDILLTDLSMPNMDGFELLQIVRSETDLPVVVISSTGDINTIKKGILNGACDYIVKPFKMEAIEMIWQHVVRKRKDELKELKQPARSNEKNGGVHLFDFIDLENKSPTTEEGSKISKKRKRSKNDENESVASDDYMNTLKKPRVIWSDELNLKFVAVINQLGIEKAVPKKILEGMKSMGVQNLTRDNVASHLQKHRMNLAKQNKAPKDEHEHSATCSLQHPEESSFKQLPHLYMSNHIHGYKQQACVDSGQVASQPFTITETLKRRHENLSIGIPLVDQMNLFESRMSYSRYEMGQPSSNIDAQVNVSHSYYQVDQVNPFESRLMSDSRYHEMGQHSSNSDTQVNPFESKMTDSRYEKGQHSSNNDVHVNSLLHQVDQRNPFDESIMSGWEYEMGQHSSNSDAQVNSYHHQVDQRNPFESRMSYSVYQKMLHSSNSDAQVNSHLQVLDNIDPNQLDLSSQANQAQASRTMGLQVYGRVLSFQNLPAPAKPSPPAIVDSATHSLMTQMAETPSSGQMLSEITGDNKPSVHQASTHLLANDIQGEVLGEKAAALESNGSTCYPSPTSELSSHNNSTPLRSPGDFSFFWTDIALVRDAPGELDFLGNSTPLWGASGEGTPSGEFDFHWNDTQKRTISGEYSSLLNDFFTTFSSEETEHRKLEHNADDANCKTNESNDEALTSAEGADLDDHLMPKPFIQQEPGLAEPKSKSDGNFMDKFYM